MYFALKSKKSGKMLTDFHGKTVGFDSADDAIKFIENYQATSRADTDLNKFFDVIQYNKTSKTRSGDNNFGFDSAY